MKYSDSFFRKADDHVICQDFATSGWTGSLRYGVLADGCSSAEGSEIGAKLLASALPLYLAHEKDFARSFHLAVGHVNGVRQAMLYPTECLYATLLLVACDGVRFHAMIQGDGFVVARRRSGTYDVIRHEFKPQPAPYYPAYWASPEDHGSYEAKFGKFVMNKDIFTFNPETNALEALDTINVTIEEFSEPSYYPFPVSDYDIVTVFSDGLAGFYQGDKASAESMIPLADVLKEIVVFKNLTGAFIQRRMQRAFERVVQLGWRTFDDFSCAGVSHE